MANKFVTHSESGANVPAYASKLCVLAVVVGMLLRTWHLVSGAPIWHDEAAVLMNVLDLNYADFFSGPLEYAEAAPPLFLCWLKLVTSLFGEAPIVFRFSCWLLSLVGLALFAKVSRALLSPVAACWAVALFAFSDRLLWHSFEAKPYSGDVFLAVLCIFLATRPRSVLDSRLSWLGLILVPIAIFSSFPAVFVLAGFLLSEISTDTALLRSPESKRWLVLSCVLAASFTYLLLGPIRAQSHPDMSRCWSHTFPDWSAPISWPIWWLKGTVGVADYAGRPVGGLLLLPMVLGIYVSYRDVGARWIVAACTPVLLASMAGFLHRYPYTGARTMAFAGPAMILLAGRGLEEFFRSERLWSKVSFGVFATPALGALLLALIHIPYPWDRADCAKASDFVRNHAQPGDKIIANNWESDFYFRDTPNYSALGEILPPYEPRIWLIFTSQTPGEADAFTSQVAGQDFHCTLYQDFRHARVMRLEPKQVLRSARSRVNDAR